MALRDEMERSGLWLFRWRSYLPLFLLALVLAVLVAAARGASAPHHTGWKVFCLCVGLAGLAVRGHTVGTTPPRTSGRNTRSQVADSLNTTGLYSVVRHPLYLGNYLMWLGVVLFPGVWWLAALVSLVFWVYYERIMYAEEAFLRGRFGTEFEEWAARTPAFLPRPRGWVPPRAPFSLRTALRKEYSGFLGLMAALGAEEVVWVRAATGRWMLSPSWAALLAGSAALALLLRFLRKRTRVLHVEGR